MHLINSKKKRRNIVDIGKTAGAHLHYLSAAFSIPEIPELGETGDIIKNAQLIRLDLICL